MERTMFQESFSPLAFRDISVDDDKSFSLAILSRNCVRGGFEYAPRPILVANPVFETFASTGGVSFFGGLQHTRAIVGMHLIERRCGSQFSRSISQHLFVRGTVVQTMSLPVDQCDHVGGIFGDDLK